MSVKGQGKAMGLASRSTVLLLLSWVSLCISVDQLSPTKPLFFPDDKLISNNGAFALGFFSPTNSRTRFYIGIWYNNIVPERTVVWVANRNNPITTPSSSTSLAVTNQSVLVLSDPQGRVYWSTANNVTGGGTAAATATALLNDKGNLVLRSSEGSTLWQSFDHPTDTILPGMPVWVNFRTRFTQSLVSWRSPEDPSAGDFSLSADVGSGIQYVIKHGPRLLWRSGAWNGEMVLDYTPNKASTVIIMSIVTNGDDISMMFSVSDGSPTMYLRVSYTGRYELTVWNTTASAWTVIEEHPGAGCDRYASCGAFGYCDVTEAVPTCKCPEGFEPNGNGTGTSPSSGSGCRRKEPLRCGDGDYFATLRGVKTPAMPVFVRNRSMESCTAECRSNCSCTAYAYTYLSTALSGGDLSRCLLWFGELVDIAKDRNINGENLYLRLAGAPTVKKKSNLAKILLPVSSFVLLLAFAAIFRTYKYRGTQQKKKIQKRLMLQYFRSTDETGDKNIEFPFISFDDIVAATDNFSDANMLGKGGFGKVYKGLLEGTNEVAVKRLSKSSGQGTEEFRNEVVLIAKLQHKNLVRLLGCCIHEDEKLLVYEYMPNKSLDYFLFDYTRNLMLQWPIRFKIIKGVARGILYLHQDSRLTIIHRDLKASNILLDKEMIPKISDFGMARIFGGDQHEANTNRVVGTYGYMSPEYAMEGVFSVKSDTYSFGVLLLEIVSGLKISSQNLITGFPNLILYAWNLWKDDKIEDLVDSYVKEKYDRDDISRCIHIGLLCVQDSPNCRPLMSAVVFMLENETTPLPIPIQPVYFACRDADSGRGGNDRCENGDLLTQAKPLSPGDLLISKDGVFALGFFSPITNSNSSLYIGIWYNNIPNHTVVWVANRDSPITAPSSAKLAITDNQELELSNSEGRTLWTTARANNTATTAGAVAVLLGSGNFVLRSANGTDMWQSFDHPTDAILPNMKVLLSYKGHVATRFVAWKGPADPSPGAFSASIDPSSNLQFFVWYGTQPYLRINFFSDASLFGGGGTASSSFVYQRTANTEDDLSYMYTVSGGSSYTRVMLEYTGKVRFVAWNNSTSSWTAGFEQPTPSCDLYASCGSFAYCYNTAAVPACRCLDGFEPIDGLDMSGGCRRNEALGRGTKDRFVPLPGMNVPGNFLHIGNTSFDQCAAECSANCSCTAYAYVNMSSAGTLAYTSRCLVWTGDLIDTGKIDNFGQNLYLQLAGRSHVRKKSNIEKILPPVMACVLLLSSIALVWRCKYRAGKQHKEARKRMMLQYLRSTDEDGDNNVELPYIRFKDLVVATNNFSDSNMIGKGGFGKVYKGFLDGTKEVAIKRLSKGSRQGTEEFRNEVVLIAKLQHKNLVKLLGCYIHEDEKLLVYEYLPNKSLDKYLFDSAPKLQWETRYKIIQGIARGILYLHQDSRLTIIHRDLKASNILLNKEMIPKISDFGMARIFCGDQDPENTNRVVGTYGYMSPEYAMEGAFSVKSDTYSFGILLLEIVSGLKISSPHLITGFPNLIAYAWNLWKDGKTEDLVDSSVKKNRPLDEVSRCIHIGLLCVQDSSDDRPLMSAVVSMLENKTTQLPIPMRPVYYARRYAEPGRNYNNRALSLNGTSFTELEGR